jgi:hypothetical protein
MRKTVQRINPDCRQPQLDAADVLLGGPHSLGDIRLRPSTVFPDGPDLLSDIPQHRATQ